MGISARRNWLRFAHSVVSPQVCPQSAIEKLGSFCTICCGATGLPPSPLGPRPTPSRRFGGSAGKLALFCRGPEHGQFIITLFPQSTCPSYRSAGIGFVSHAMTQRWRPRLPCRLSPIPAAPGKLALFRTISNKELRLAQRRQDRKVQECHNVSSCRS